MIYVEVDRRNLPEALTDLQTAISTVLNEVQVAVNDYPR